MCSLTLGRSKATEMVGLMELSGNREPVWITASDVNRGTVLQKERCASGKGRELVVCRSAGTSMIISALVTQ